MSINVRYSGKSEEKFFRKKIKSLFGCIFLYSVEIYHCIKKRRIFFNVFRISQISSLFCLFLNGNLIDFKKKYILKWAFTKFNVKYRGIWDVDEIFWLSDKVLQCSEKLLRTGKVLQDLSSMTAENYKTLSFKRPPVHVHWKNAVDCFNILLLS